MPQDIRLRWDQGNLEHATRHAVPRREIDELVEYGIWVMVGNTRGRTSQRRIIGVSPSGRLVTLVVELTELPGTYRPVTSRPATEREESLYYEFRRRRGG